MTPRIACRSNPIIVAIVILLVAQSTRGFTIHRNPEKTETESTADLAVAESTLLEVKNDLNRPNDIKAFEFIKQDGLDKTQTTDSLKSKFSTDDLISKLNKNEKGVKSPEGFYKNVPELTKNYSNGNTHITTLIFKTISEDLTTDTTTGRGSKQLESSSNSDVTTSVSNPAQLIKITSTLPFREMTETDSPYTSTQLTSVSATNIEKEELTTAYHDGEYNSAGTTIFSNYNLGAEVNTLQDSTLSDGTSYTAENDTESNPTFIDKESTNYNKNKQHSSDSANFTRKNAPVNTSKSILDIVLTTTIPAEEVSKTINQLSTAIDNTSGIIDLIPILNSSTNFTTANSITSEKTTKLKENTPTEDPTSISTTEPTWRKYTVIDRKRLTTPEVSIFTEIEEVTKVGTSPTRISLEEALTITPIASLERLREDLIANKNKLVAMHGPSSTTDWNLTSELLSTISTPVLKKTEGKVGMVSSMRAGFLDYSGKATTSERSITEDVKATYATVYDKDDGEIDRMTNKYRNDVESQSQLAEDAIKEELLKEEMINNNEANAQRYRDDRADIAGVEPLTFDVKNAQESQSQLTENKTATEKALNVQPITQEPGKNLDLYAVNPNYKPMKRIEVQPAKPFVRDPDDNSWRNESISSLGIVFKPKNSSKSFTQVLKNKTEIVLSSLTERDNKNGVPDLRERLEKIAEVRKSKKKRINKFGDTVYTDYEETSGSGESFTTPKSTATFSQDPISIKTTATLSSLSNEDRTTLSKETTEIDGKITNTSETNATVKEKTIKNNAPETLTTPKQKKIFNVAEYYDTTDEYDADYLTLSKIDLKKFTVPLKVKETVVTPPTEILQTKPMSPYPPDRQPTIQYFPPRVMPKVKVHDYDENFNRKVNQYTLQDIPKDTTIGPTRRPVPLVLIQNEKTKHKENEVEPTLAPPIRPFNLNKNTYIPSVPPLANQPQGFVANNGDYNRASYVIKHYGDFINEAAKDDDDRNSDYVVLTEPPIRGITVDELAKLTTGKPVTIDNDYDYETLFRKDILNRFVDNFNQNSERFKVDFPVLYNNSIVHRRIQDNDGGLASSSALMKRLYNDVAANKPNYLPLKKPCEPNCENITVELSPAYELHYYVPDQEEKEVMDPRVGAAQYRLRL